MSGRQSPKKKEITEMVKIKNISSSWLMVFWIYSTDCTQWSSEITKWNNNVIQPSWKFDSEACFVLPANALQILTSQKVCSSWTGLKSCDTIAVKTKLSYDFKIGITFTGIMNQALVTTTNLTTLNWPNSLNFVHCFWIFYGTIIKWNFVPRKTKMLKRCVPLQTNPTK